MHKGSPLILEVGSLGIFLLNAEENIYCLPAIVHWLGVKQRQWPAHREELCESSKKKFWEFVEHIDNFVNQVIGGLPIVESEFIEFHKVYQ